MAELNKILVANEDYSKGFKYGACQIPPSRKLAVLACMDARLTVEDLLGLNTGEAHIIRNAGQSQPDDAIRSLLISHEFLGTQEFLVINHTDCGMLTFADEGYQTSRHKNKQDRYKWTPKFHSFPILRRI